MHRIRLLLVALIVLFSAKLHAQELVRFRLIVVKTRAEAEQILARLKKGESFSKLAKENSLAPSASSGGDVGDMKVEDLRTDIKDMLLSLKVGQISGIIKAFGGYALIKREALSEKYRAKEHFKKGVQLLKEEHFNEAVAELKKALALDPELDLARLNLGVVYGEMGMIDKAILQFRKLLLKDPNNPMIHNNLAVAYFKKGAYKLAIRHCDEAIRLGGKVNPKFLEALKPYRR